MTELKELTCGRCDHEWDYTGSKSHPAMTNCPNCMQKVRIPEKTEG